MGELGQLDEDGLAALAARCFGVSLSAGVGVVLQDSDGRIVAANQAAELILGRSFEDMQGRSSGDPRWAAIDVHGFYLPTGRHPAMQALRTGRPVVGAVIGVHRPSADLEAEHVWVSVTSRPVQEAGSAVITSFEELVGADGEFQRLRESERRFRWIAQNASDMVAILAPDTNHLWVSPSCLALTGYRPDEMIGRTILEFIHPGDLDAARLAARAVVAGTTVERLTYRFRHADGHFIWVESIGRAFAGDEADQIQVSTRDVSARVAIEGERDAALAEMTAVFDNAPIGKVIVDDQGSVVRANQALLKLMGYTAAQMAEKTLIDLTYPEDAAVTAEDFRLLITGEVTTSSLEKRYVRADGEIIWAQRTATRLPDAAGGRSLFIIQLVDVTEQKRAQAVLAAMAVTDPLTGLPNRAVLTDRLTHALAVAHRSRTLVGVIFCDLDWFKQVNDTLGHEAGDELLRLVAGRIRATVRESDTVVRLGGDEFVVLCENISDYEPVRMLAARLQKSIDEPYMLASGLGRVSVSIGIAVGDGPSAAAMLQLADESMYRAKRAGRDGIDVYKAAVVASAADQLALQRDLDGALLRDDLRLFYQPIVALPDRRLVALEALLRWQHPRRGLVMPDAFLPAVEYSPLSRDLGRWVVEHACKAAGAWLDHTTVAVNVSPRQFSSNGFADHVLATLAKTGLPATSLCIEITETSVLNASPSTLRSAQSLVERGVGLSLDDFGTGQSSISALHRLPVRELKIDRSFVMHVLKVPRVAALVHGLIRLGSGMGLDVIAEGIETDDQADWLLEHGCLIGQGYLFGRPQPLTVA